MKPAPFLVILACCASLAAVAQDWAKQDLEKSSAPNRKARDEAWRRWKSLLALL